jgi:hypothetical protein
MMEHSATMGRFVDHANVPNWVEVTTPAGGSVSLCIFFLKNGVQIAYNGTQSSFLLKEWDDDRARAICQTMIEKADDREPYVSYTEDAKKRKKALKRFLKRKDPFDGPLLAILRKAWKHREENRKRVLRELVKGMSPDEIATAQVEDVMEG